jgi:hypothetical protein
MNKFLAVFTISPDKMAAFQKNPEAQQLSVKGVSAWHQWMEDNKTSVVEMGGPLSSTTRIANEGISASKNNLGGYLVVQAESQADAAKLFLNHPSFAIFPGDAVEVMEILPIPEKP